MRCSCRSSRIPRPTRLAALSESMWFRSAAVAFGWVEGSLGNEPGVLLARVLRLVAVAAAGPVPVVVNDVCHATRFQR